MRSLLFVPGDSEKKLTKAATAGADVLLVDLEDSVGLDNKVAARRIAAGFIAATRETPGAPAIYVRVNALDSGLTDADLDAVMAAAPAGIMLPKAGSGADVARLDAKLAVREATYDLADGATRIIAIATETAGALFTLASYRDASPRLAALSWGAEDLSAELGAHATREPDGRWTRTFALARTLCLAGAVHAGAMPIDTVFTSYRDTDGLRAEAEEAARDGFTGKLAIHPAQVPVINEVFTPSREAIAEARTVIAAFREAGEAGVVGVGGQMLDRPHVKRAERLIERARAAGIDAPD